MSNRAWAIGLTAEDFHHAYLRRFPMADVIPEMNEYLAGSDPVYNGIGEIAPDSYEPDTGENPIREEKKETVAVFACRGCGKVFHKHIARLGHERHCKAIIKGVANAGT